MLHLSRRSLIRSPNCDAGTPNKKSGVEIERTAENRTRRLDTPIVTNAEVDRRIAEALEAERKVAIPPCVKPSMSCSSRSASAPRAT